MNPNTARRVFVAALAIVAGGTGCNLPPGQGGWPGSGMPASEAQLMSIYEDLAPGKYLVIADFETPIQGALFRKEPVGGPGVVEISTQQARRETGIGSLRISLTDSSQQAVAENRPGSQWTLPPDWTPYHLLVFSVFSSRPLNGFHLRIRSGTEVPLAATPPRIALEPGWNLVRIDLGALADEVNLADVRELRFWCEPLESPVDLYLDDLMLVNNARHIFGPAEPAPGDLYVRSQGRRLVVGATERFELSFSEGLIRQWYDLSSDPVKARSLTGGLPLGPVPVIPPRSADPAGWLDELLAQNGPQPGVNVTQTLEQISPQRALIRCEQTPAAGAPALSAAPARQWVYSVYPDGRVYVECSGTLAEPGAAEMGMAFWCDTDAGFRPALIGPSDDGAAGFDPFALYSREGRGQADLLVAPFGSATGQIVRRAEDPRVCTLWRIAPPDDRYQFAALLRVWPTDVDSAAQAAPLAADYRHPLPVLVDVGGLARTDPGDFDGDGFSEGRGYYVLQLDGSVAKLRVSGRRRLRFSPVFKLINVADRNVWVYVDGRLLETSRDSQGDVLFVVQGTISGETLVEVTSREKNAP